MNQCQNQPKLKRRLANGGGLLLALILLLMLVAVLTSGAAEPAARQPELPRATPVANPGVLTPLACARQPQDGLAVAVKLTNNSGQTLAPGTRVHWQTAHGLADWVTVTEPRGLPPGGTLIGVSGDWLNGGPCTAHFFKP